MNTYVVIPRTQYTTAQQRENLWKLAARLRAMPPPNIRFNMETYYKQLPNECGTIACAIGCASEIVAPREIAVHYFDEMYQAVVNDNLDGENALGSHDFESWDAYAKRLFGFSNNDDGAGGWCFEADWAQVDNTPLGAARRIEWYLEHGLPDDWYGQMKGRAPLCYQENNDAACTD